MSEMICKGCGGITNTTVCDWLEHKDKQPRKCYMKFGENGWERGCHYDFATKFIKMFVDKYIRKVNKNDT